MAALAALLICLLAGSAALAQESSEPPPPPPPPDEKQQSPRNVEQTQRRQDARRNAAVGEAVRQRDRGISPLRYGLGGLVGTFYGLGIGHAIVGEWSNKGWIFTVGEIGSFVVIGAGLAQALPRNATDLERRRGGTIALAGAVAWSAFRFYEIYDVWTRPKVASVNKPVDTAFAVGPVGQEGGFGALLRLRW
jgi:hypothetical protein